MDDGSVRDVVVQGNLNSWFWMRDRPCANKTSYGSMKDTERLCPRCRIDQNKRVAGQNGMWFSYYYDREKGKSVIKERNPESEASQKARGVWKGRTVDPSTPAPRRTSAASSIIIEEPPCPPPRPSMPNFWAAMAQVEELQRSRTGGTPVLEQRSRVRKVM